MVFATERAEKSAKTEFEESGRNHVDLNVIRGTIITQLFATHIKPSFPKFTEQNDI